MIAGWLLIGILVILVLVAIFKSQDLIFVFILIKKYLFFGISLLVILFFVFSFYSVYSNNNVDFTSFGGILEVAKDYGVWFKGFLGNIGRVSGNAVNQEWFENSENITEVP